MTVLILPDSEPGIFLNRHYFSLRRLFYFKLGSLGHRILLYEHQFSGLDKATGLQAVEIHAAWQL